MSPTRRLREVSERNDDLYGNHLCLSIGLPTKQYFTTARQIDSRDANKQWQPDTQDRWRSAWGSLLITEYDNSNSLKAAPIDSSVEKELESWRLS